MKRLLTIAALACALAFAAGPPPVLVVPDGPPPCSAQGTGPYVSGGRFVIQASHDLASGSGTVRRFGLGVSGEGAASISAAATWDAARLLDAVQPSDRKIHTLVHDDVGRSRNVDFTWHSLPEATKTLLDAGDGLGEARVAFLGGDRSREVGREGGMFRKRTSVMGDIVNSVPLLVAAPSVSVRGAGYAQFHAGAKNRRAAVYVGANDGMLHAFDANDGAELFAYVPLALHAALPSLSKAGAAHRAYVDGSPGQGEAFIAGQWRTVLVSGMGMGARGVFALDVSDPARFTSGLGAIWEFTDRDDAAMGHVRAAPQIAKLRIGVDGTVPQFRYFAVVSSGINNDGPEALFLLALDKPPSEPWRHKTNYFRVSMPASSPNDANALSPPVLALAPDGSARYAYAGDLEGNLWRFDFTGKPSSWPDAAGPGPGNKPLFVARDASGNPQPISHAPSVVHAAGSGYLVLFGTGKLIEAADADPSTYAVQTFYAIRDSLGKPAALIAGRHELGPRSDKGWYIDFPHSLTEGERSAAPAVLISGTAVVDTVAPRSAGCADLLVRSYIVDVLTGVERDRDGVAVSAPTGTVVQRSGITGPSMLVSTGAVESLRTPTGATVATRSVAVFRPGAESSPQLVSVSKPAKRVSWREVANWRELHEAAIRQREGR